MSASDVGRTLNYLGPEIACVECTIKPNLFLGIARVECKINPNLVLGIARVECKIKGNLQQQSGHAVRTADLALFPKYTFLLQKSL